MAGRKPVHLAAVGGAQSARDAMWATIRRLKRVTNKDFDGTIPANTARNYLRGLERAGYVRREAVDPSDRGGRFQPVAFVLARDVGVEAPRVNEDGTPVLQGLPREQMWRTMKVLGEFSPRDLAVHASTEHVAVNAEDARIYCRYLSRAGYLAQTAPGGPGRAPRYRFLRSRDTGPRPPMIQRVRHVFDPNTGQVVWRGEGGEA